MFDEPLGGYIMRKLLLVLLLALTLIMGGCSKDDEPSPKSIESYQEYIYEWDSGIVWYIYVDKETDEMYLASPRGFDGGIALLYEDGGEPMLWAENKDDYLDEEE